MLIQGPAVVVGGARAAALAAVLRHVARRGALPPELHALARELDLAANAWFSVPNREQREPAPSPDMPHSAVSSPGGGVQWVSTREAAKTLGISPRGLRKSAASRGGVFVGGRWLWPPDIAAREAS